MARCQSLTLCVLLASILMKHPLCTAVDIVSPDTKLFADQFDNADKCDFNITVSKTNVIHLSFKDMRTRVRVYQANGSTSLMPRFLDIIEVRESVDRLNFRLFEGIDVMNYISTRNSVCLREKREARDAMELDYMLDYSAMPPSMTQNEDKCGGVVEASSKWISGPLYPKEELAFMDCSTRFIGSENKVIRLRVHSLTVTPPFRGGSLIVSDPPSGYELTVYKFMKNTTTIILPGNSVDVRVSSYIKMGDGLKFTAYYDSVDPVKTLNEAECGMVYRDKAGEIKSPRSTEEGFSVIFCDYIIHVSPGKKVSMKFEYVQKLPDFNDRLFVREGSNATGKLLERYDNGKFPRQEVFPHQTIHLRLISYANNGFRNQFKATYVETYRNW